MKADDITRPALRYHGGKFRLAPWVMQFFPPHHRYVEPFGGAAGVLLRKPRCHAEIYNDLDSDITNFFRVVRDPVKRAQLIEACQLTPYSRDEWELAYEHSEDTVERARRTAVRAAMGFGSAGATKGRTGFRIDTARAWSTAMHDWTGYPPHLAAIGERMTGVRRQHTTSSRISAGRGTVLRTESVWLNSACAEALEHAAGGLFAGLEAT